MNHLIMIDHYIIRQYAELLDLPLAAGSRSALGIAYDFLASLDINDAYYCKILYDQETTAIISRNNFSVLHQMALAAASLSESSFKNFYTPVTTNEQVAFDAVRRYLAIRNNLTPLRLADATASNMGTMEKDAYHELALVEYKKTIEGEDDTIEYERHRF